MTALQKIIAEAKKIRKKYPKKEWKDCVAQASAIYAKKHKGKSPVGKKSKKVGAVKKKAAKKKSATSYHKDTASHNVRIKVISGASEFSLLQLKRNNESIERLSKVILDNKNKMKSFQYKTPFWKSYFTKKNKEISSYINTLKKQNTQLKKHI